MTPKPGQVYRHRNGNIYEVCLLTNVGSEREEYPPTVVYENVVTGALYSRPVARWTEKSFTFLATKGST